MNLRERGGMITPGARSEAGDAGGVKVDGRGLQVLIWGAGSRQDHFDQILAANIQRWGYDARILPTGFFVRQEQSKVAKADVLVCDLDVTSRGSMRYVDTSSVAHEPQLPNWNDVGRSCARLVIALSSRSVPRSALEQLGAVALLHKPFEMAQLQRYLHVLQKVLVGRPPSEEAPSRVCESTLEGCEKQARVLVVDDHKEVANTIRECLECEPLYDVRVANEGLEALEQCIDWQPDCIVTDLLMPWMNGNQIMRSLSAGISEYTPAFVVLSALPQYEHSMYRDLSKGKEIVFLDKPFQVNQLLQAVEYALAQ